MAKFCGKCGAKLDSATGLCPNCDAAKINELHQQSTGPIWRMPQDDEFGGESNSSHTADSTVEHAGSSGDGDLNKAYKTEWRMPGSQDLGGVDGAGDLPGSSDALGDSGKKNDNRPQWNPSNRYGEAPKMEDKKNTKSNRKADKKAAKKAKKKEKWENMTLAQKLAHCLIYMLFIFLLAIVTGMLIVGVVYSDLRQLKYDYFNLPATGRDKEEVIIYDSGDVIYVPSDSNIKLDETSGSVYYDNLLTVYTFEDVSSAVADDLASLVGGEVVGDVSGSVNMLQILVPASSLTTLQEKCDTLMESSFVLYAAYSFPMEISQTTSDSNPWTDTQKIEEDRGNESEPSGNDWWAEAIGAYTAWEYEQYTSHVDVGILDAGFDTDHEDLTNKISIIPDNINTESYHGTHVAGIISANNNSVGIRGVFDNTTLHCVDLAPDGDGTKGLEFLSSGEYIVAIKKLIDSGVKVFNLSVGLEKVKTIESLRADVYDKSNDGTPNKETNDFIALLQDWYLGVSHTYDSYLDYRMAVSDRTGTECLVLMIQLLLNGKDDFLIVKSAGNGYDGETKGTNTKYTGYFASVDEDLFNAVLSETARTILEQKGINYTKIKSRILVVGAVKNNRDKNGNYRMTKFSNYGVNLDICAPGDSIYSTICDNEYKELDGTSMAAPMVAASAAYVWSIDQTLTAPQVKEILIDSAAVQAVGVGEDKGTLYPMLNVGEAVKRVIKPVDNVIQGERDIVLVLDTSGSMSGTPMTETKKASAKFIDTILDEDASIGIVTYDNNASMLSDFSVNKTVLTEAVSSIWDGGGTNIEAGLAEARAMLNTSGARKKIIVLMSDGEPNEGKEGDALISYADEIKDDGIIIYTLGFFESLGSYKSSAQILMEGIASDGCHYEVASADDLVFFFEDMADQINGQKYIYIRIACPVDVTVTHNGESLCSDEEDLNTRTDFGTLTFEESERSNAGADDRVKVLRLKEGTNYDVQIVGTGRGMMDYTIGFMDEEGEYSDLRTFENIKITKRTVIDTVAEVSNKSTLRVDEDGDGKYDISYRAEENGYGEEYNDTAGLYLYIGIAGFILLAYVVVWQTAERRKRRT